MKFWEIKEDIHRGLTKFKVSLWLGLNIPAYRTGKTKVNKSQQIPV